MKFNSTICTIFAVIGLVTSHAFGEPLSCMCDDEDTRTKLNTAAAVATEAKRSADPADDIIDELFVWG